MLQDSEYHRRRAESEMQLALTAAQIDEAMRHLELARIHRERRDALAIAWRDCGVGSRPPIDRADKEG